MTDYLPEAKALARNYETCIEGMAKRGPLYQATKAKAKTLNSLIAEVERLREAEERRKQERPKAKQKAEGEIPTNVVKVEYETMSGEKKVGYVGRRK